MLRRVFIVLDFSENLANQLQRPMEDSKDEESISQEEEVIWRLFSLLFDDDQVWDACDNGDLEEVKRLVEEEGAGMEHFKV